MKVKFFITASLFISFLCIGIQGQCQNAYYEALYLSKISAEEIETILSYNNFKELNTRRTLSEAKGKRDEVQAKINAANKKIEKYNDGLKILETKEAIDTNSLKKLIKERMGNKVKPNDPLDKKINIAIQFLRKEITKEKNNIQRAETELPELEIEVLKASNNSIFLNEKEFKALQNLVQFIKKPWSDTVESPNFSLIINAIKRYNLEISKNGEGGEDKISGIAAGGILTLLGSIPNIVGGISDFSGQTESDLYDGLAKYTAKAFKEGVTQAYFQLMEERLDSIGELQILFPETYELFKNTDPFQFPELGGKYKDVFEIDLKEMLGNTVKYIQDKNNDGEGNLFLDSKLLKTLREKEEFQVLTITADIGDQLIQKQHPVDILNYLDLKYYHTNTEKDKKGFEKIVHYANIVQHNLRDTSKIADGKKIASVWINFEDLAKLNTVDKLNYFAALIYQQDRDFFKEIEPFKTILSANNPSEDINLMKWKAHISTITTEVEKILNHLDEFKASKGEDFYDAEFVDFLQAMLDLMENVDGIINPDSPFLDKETLKIGKNALGIYQSIHKKDLDLIVNNVIEILELVIKDDATIQNPDFIKVISALNKYGSFFTEVTKAENSDEMELVISKYVASPSTFMVKRESQFAIAISTMPNYYFAKERIYRPGQEYEFNSGLSMPVGIDFSWAINKSKDDKSLIKKLNNKYSPKTRTGHSFSVYAQVIDLGAILNFRISDTTNTLPDTVSFDQIFSPGISLNWGIKNSPINIGVGYQRAPKLRGIKLEDGLVEEPRRTDRIFLRFAWDIPLINIYASKHRN